RSFTFFKFAAGSVRCAMREKYDVAFATTTPLTAGIPGIFAKWIRRKPFVFEVRDLWPELPREMGVITNPFVLLFLSALEWSAYRSAERCVALSPGIADGIARRGVCRTKIAMVPNGCDFKVFSNERDTIGTRPDGVASEDLMAIYTGTHGQANGLHAVLDAARELKSRDREDIKLVLIGDGKMKLQLQRDALAHGLDNVIFHERVNKSELASLMANADIGIQCLANVPAFYFGTSPNKFFDYIACGLPVLNNYPGWLAKLVIDNACGYAIPPEDPDAFADALEAAADDRENLFNMGVRARNLAQTDFDRQSLAEQWVAWVTADV
ncbi:glycosyltransferase family 4 protein, partial [bacterium]|nr:glycosyltransferase family 4 protein [bacterium]